MTHRSFAQLTLTDNNGKLDMHVAYHDGGKQGLNIANPSHEHMLLLIATLDQMAEPEGEPVHILLPNGNEKPAIERNADGQVIAWNPVS